MKKYQNLGGNSDVTGYEFTKDVVTIRFASHSVYKYNVQTAGNENIKKMKELAHAGKGLGTFIAANLKDRSARRVR